MLVAYSTEPPVRAPIPGQVIGARFLVEREIGAGGMGAVSAAVDLVTGAHVALKLMRAELAGDQRAVERFRREGAALAAVRHPAIVQVREIGELDDGSLYIAMELLQGETLAGRLARVRTMSPTELLPIVLCLCEGLSAAHAGGIIHRDVKPSNIHLPPAAPGTVHVPAKLMDFGVARVRGLSHITSSGLAVGTVRYMAPEQLTAGAIDERVDVYALGVVLYEALAGEHPFARTGRDDVVGTILVGRVPPLSSMRPDLHPALTRVVHRAMARLPTERISSAAALAEAFWRAVTMPDRDPFEGGLAQHLAATELAPTLPAVRVAPHTAAGSALPESGVRAKSRRRTRAAPWLLLSLLGGLCFVPVAGIAAGSVGCGAWLADVQMQYAQRKLRKAILAHGVPELAADLDALEQLHAREGVGLVAATAFNARVQHVVEADDWIDRDELFWVMEVVRDIVAHDGQYDLARYREMTQGIPRE